MVSSQHHFTVSPILLCCTFIFIQFNILFSFCWDFLQKKNIKGIWIGKEALKLFLFALRLPLWSMDSLEMPHLVSRCSEILLLSAADFWLIPLWLENPFYMISISLNLLRFVLYLKMWRSEVTWREYASFSCWMTCSLNVK